MFTGIVEELGQVHKIEHCGDYARLEIRATTVLADMHQGDSVAVNGVCQTVEHFDTQNFTVAAFAETLKKTNLGALQAQNFVHLERAVTLNTRLGGHMVQGHVDGPGYLQKVYQKENNYYLYIQLPQNLLDLCVLHGSICLDGVSLTIAELHNDNIVVNLIAHTWENTLFQQYSFGTAINVECDILGKYLLRFVQRGLAGKEQDQDWYELLKKW